MPQTTAFSHGNSAGNTSLKSFGFWSSFCSYKRCPYSWNLSLEGQQSDTSRRHLSFSWHVSVPCYQGSSSVSTMHGGDLPPIFVHVRMRQLQLLHLGFEPGWGSARGKGRRLSVTKPTGKSERRMRRCSATEVIHGRYRGRAARSTCAGIEAAGISIWTTFVQSSLHMRNLTMAAENLMGTNCDTAALGSCGDRARLV